MQTLFETQNYLIYREEGLTYLKNGTVKQIETGQCNSLLTKLHGLTDEQAENFIKSEYEQGSIRVIEELTPVRKPVIVLKRILQHIYEITNGNKIRYMVKIKVRINGVYKDFGKRFPELNDAVKFRDDLKEKYKHERLRK